MRFFRLRSALASGVAATLLLGAPAAYAADAGKKAAKENNRYVARDVETLYNAAKNQLDKRRYKLAAALFDEVERQHPYSIWARRAELMSAFSHYLAQDYPESIDAAQRFLSIHPGNKDAPYAMYLIGVAYYEQIGDVNRDQKTAQQALDAMGELIRRYPDTSYAADARLKVDLINDHLAGREMDIGRFYERRNEWLAASFRFRRVVENYQTTSHVPEALLRLTESYLELGLPDEARKSAAVLGANYPGTDWYQRAYGLIERNEGVSAARSKKQKKVRTAKKA
ncbi:MAG: outer membrane protein assembly factor BamD [Sphingomonas sp.]|nr:outer membrane protein assembly factor BamD [Sphingomonas sp.]